MLVTRLIERKRDGGRLEAGEWSALIRSYVAGDVPDYQMAAMLMAVYVHGLDRTETAALTDAMRRSGDQLSLGHLTAARVDKHSTGGVGDKTSLILAPLVSSLGVAVPMMTGRGLGHTGEPWISWNRSRACGRTSRSRTRARSWSGLAA